MFYIPFKNELKSYCTIRDRKSLMRYKYHNNMIHRSGCGCNLGSLHRSKLGKLTIDDLTRLYSSFLERDFNANYIYVTNFLNNNIN